jgi:AcrR family transcriptional regulator
MAQIYKQAALTTTVEASANPSLRSRKHQFVQEAIFNAAIEKFAANGFDDTTIDDVARAAGVSRASFFRYFSSKDDLLAQNVMKYGAALIEGIKACPPSFSPFRIMRETVLAVAQQTVSHPRTRQVIDISLRSPAAMQAHGSRMVEVEDSVAGAFAERLKGSKDDLETRLLAAMTVSAMNVAIMAWHRGNCADLSAAVEQVFSNLVRIVGGQTVRMRSQNKKAKQSTNK